MGYPLLSQSDSSSRMYAADLRPSLQKHTVDPKKVELTTPFRTWTEVDLDALRHNVCTLRKQLKRGAEFMAVVKSNAYGHGAVETAVAAVEAGAQHLGVANVAQGIALRDAGLTKPILLLGPVIPEEMRPGIEADLTFSVSSEDEVAALADRSRAIHQGRRRGRKTKVHLMVDTGMGRSGFMPSELWPAAERVTAEKTLDLEGVFTHFSAAEDSDTTISEAQIRTFKELTRSLEEGRISFRIRHMANSAGTIFFPDAQMDLVRCGAAMYGMRPWDTSRENLNLQQVMSLHTRIVHLGKRPSGWPVGYNSKFICNQDSVLATIPVGYGEGYRRALSGRSEVLLRGVRVPIVGTISMDYIVLDVTEVANKGSNKSQDVEVGEVVTLIGKQHSEEITLEELAKKSGTIPYVITTHISAAMERVYVGSTIAEETEVEENTDEPRADIVPADFEKETVEEDAGDKRMAAGA